jgi:hypothetical protein
VKIEGSAKTLYKIATAGGSIETELVKETKKLQEGAQESEKTRIKERLIYLFCLTVTNSTELKPERKVQLLNELQKAMLTEPTVSLPNTQQGRPVYLRNCYGTPPSSSVPFLRGVLVKWRAEDGAWKQIPWNLPQNDKELRKMTYGNGKLVRSIQKKVFVTMIFAKSASQKVNLDDFLPGDEPIITEKGEMAHPQEIDLQEDSGDFILVLGLSLPYPHRPCLV